MSASHRSQDMAYLGAARAGGWSTSATLDDEFSKALPARTGRPSLRPSHEQRDIVVAMAFAGFTHERIARAMGMSENSLRKHFADELQSGADRMLAEVVQTLANKARAGDTTAGIWITKARLGWREQPKQLEVSGAEGKPLDAAEKQRLVQEVRLEMEALAARAYRAERALLALGISIPEP